MRQVILDTETTGLELKLGHRVIEVGCVELVNRRRTTRTLHHYLQPDRPIDPGAQEVHGISMEMLRDSRASARSPRISSLSSPVPSWSSTMPTSMWAFSMPSSSEPDARQTP
jgi:DNA polymerase III epsilon subunit-like protein